MPNKVILGLEPDDSLRHFGILGMKWGQRRYQNSDGSLTKAGERRYEKRSITDVVKGKDMGPERALASIGEEGRKIVSQRENFIKNQVKEIGWLETAERTGTYAYEDAVKIFKLEGLNPRVGQALEVALNDRYIAAIDSDEDIQHSTLQHFGIPGMKWGVRRYQKKDGSRTPAGKRRDAARPDDSDDATSTRQNRSRGVSALSNDELRKVNERMQLENTYRQLTSQQVQKGNTVVRDILARSAQGALGTIATAAMVGAGKAAFRKISPDFYNLAFPSKEQKKQT